MPTWSEVRAAMAALGVKETQPFAEAKKTYTRALRHAHPDTGGSADSFHKLKEAWDLVGDPQYFDQVSRRFEHAGLFQIRAVS